MAQDVRQQAGEIVSWPIASACVDALLVDNDTWSCRQAQIMIYPPTGHPPPPPLLALQACIEGIGLCLEKTEGGGGGIQGGVISGLELRT